MSPPLAGIAGDGAAAAEAPDAFVLAAPSSSGYTDANAINVQIQNFFQFSSKLK